MGPFFLVNCPWNKIVHLHVKYLKIGTRGCGQCCTITLLHMNRLNKTESAIFVSLMCSLLPEDLYSELSSNKNPRL